MAVEAWASSWLSGTIAHLTTFRRSLDLFENPLKIDDGDPCTYKVRKLHLESSL